MIDVQNSVKSMEGRCAQFENSLKEVQETNNKLIESNNQISEDVGNLNKKVAKLESDLKVSEEKESDWKLNLDVKPCAYTGCQRKRMKPGKIP